MLQCPWFIGMKANTCCFCRVHWMQAISFHEFHQDFLWLIDALLPLLPSAGSVWCQITVMWDFGFLSVSVAKSEFLASWQSWFVTLIFRKKFLVAVWLYQENKCKFNSISDWNLSVYLSTHLWSFLFFSLPVYLSIFLNMCIKYVGVYSLGQL